MTKNSDFGLKSAPNAARRGVKSSGVTALFGSSASAYSSAGALSGIGGVSGSGGYPPVGDEYPGVLPFRAAVGLYERPASRASVQGSFDPTSVCTLGGSLSHSSSSGQSVVDSFWRSSQNADQGGPLSTHALRAPRPAYKPELRPIQRADRGDASGLVTEQTPGGVRGVRPDGNPPPFAGFPPAQSSGLPVPGPAAGFSRGPTSLSESLESHSSIFSDSSLHEYSRLPELSESCDYESATGCRAGFNSVSSAPEMLVIPGRVGGDVSPEFEALRKQHLTVVVDYQSLKKQYEDLHAENNRMRNIIKMQHDVIDAYDSVVQESLTCIQSSEATLDRMVAPVNMALQKGKEARPLKGYFQKRTNEEIERIMAMGVSGKQLSKADIGIVNAKLAAFANTSRDREDSVISDELHVSADSLDGCQADLVQRNVSVVPRFSEMTIENLMSLQQFSPEALCVCLDKMRDEGKGISSFFHLICINDQIRRLIPAIVGDILAEVNFFLPYSTQNFASVYTCLELINVEPSAFNRKHFEEYVLQAKQSRFIPTAAFPLGRPSENVHFFTGSCLDPEEPDNVDTYLTNFIMNYLKWRTDTSKQVREIVAGLAE